MDRRHWQVGTTVTLLGALTLALGSCGGGTPPAAGAGGTSGGAAVNKPPLNAGGDKADPYAKRTVPSISAMSVKALTLTGTNFVSDLGTVSDSNGWGPFERDMSVGEDKPLDGRPLTLNGVTYKKGLGVHAASELVYALGGSCNSFSADVGLDDEIEANGYWQSTGKAKGWGSVVFQVWADGVKKYESPVMRFDSPTQKVSVNIAGAQQLKLVVRQGDDDFKFDHADWASAQVNCTNPNATLSNDDTYKAGLELWRRPNAITVNGQVKMTGSCQSCHQTGFSTFMYNFSDADILRRAQGDGANEEEAKRLVGFFHASREKYGLTPDKLLDPMKCRPLQTGPDRFCNLPTPGQTPEARNESFAQGPLKAALPTLLTTTVTTLEQARKVAGEYKTIDLSKLPVPIEFPRFSEDRFHGPEHASWNKWLPMPGFDVKAGLEQEWFAKFDKYLAEPTDANMMAIYDGVTQYTTTASPKPMDLFMLRKWRSMLVIDHFMRARWEGHPERDYGNTRAADFAKLHVEPSDGSGSYLYTNFFEPLFDAGDFCKHPQELKDADVPDFIKATLNSNIETQLATCKDPMWYAGFVTQPDMQFAREREEYFAQDLGREYTFLDLLMVGKANFHRAFYSDGWKPRAQLSVWDIDLGKLTDPWYFSNSSNFVSSDSRRMFYQAQANLLRTYLLLAKDALGRGDRPAGDLADHLYRDLGVGLSFVTTYDSRNLALDYPLFQDVMNALVPSKPVNFPVPVTGSGTGLKAEYFNSPNFTGTPVTGIDSLIDFDFISRRDQSFVAPQPGFAAQSSVRWTGQIQARCAGTYTFARDKDTTGTARLTIDGKPVISGGTSGTIALDAGKKYDLKLEYQLPSSPVNNHPAMKLYWQSACQDGQVVPTSQLYPAS